MDFTFSSDQEALRDAVRSFLAAEAPKRIRAAHGRARRRRHHARAVAPDRRPRVDGSARARSARRSRPRHRRRGRRAGGDGPRAVSRPVLLVGDRRDARGARPRSRRPARRARGRDASAARSRSTKPATATRSSACACARTVAARATSSTASSRWCMDGSLGRLGARPRAHARRSADVPRRARRRSTRELAPSLDVTRKFARFEFDETRAHARRPARRSRAPSGAASPTTPPCCSRPSSSA